MHRLDKPKAGQRRPNSAGGGNGNHAPLSPATDELATLAASLAESEHAAEHSSAAAAQVSSAPLPAAAPACHCEHHRALRCNTRLYALLHRQIELDPLTQARNQAAAQRVKEEKQRMAVLMGESGTRIEPEPTDHAAALAASASLRFHASDFALGNLKNQSTRIVLAPTVRFAPRLPTDLYFTSLQTGSIKRKSRAKVTPKLILDEILSFAQTNISSALASLGTKKNLAALPTQEERAWEMEKQEYTQQIITGSKDGTGGKRPSSARQNTKTKSNVPHYMTAIRPVGQKSPLAEMTKSARSRPGSAQAKPQHPLTSSPSTPPAQHCDILAQFTFAADCPRFDNQYLPYTQVSATAAPVDPHLHPDILYFSIRSLHHFLTVVNANLDKPRAWGILQPFVRPREERNTVYRAAFVAMPTEEEEQEEEERRQSARNRAPSFPTPGSSLPPCFHVSVEARQNQLKLTDRAAVASSHLEFSLAERAVTFDASHLSMVVESREREREAARRRAMGESSGEPDEGNVYVLYPRKPSEVANVAADNSNTRPSSAAAATPARTTVILPSNFPYSPSAHTAAHRLTVSPALQARIQAAMLRMVAHVNELYRAEARRMHPPIPGSSQQPPQAQAVGFMECFFKLDAAGNLFLLTCRSLKMMDPPSSPTPVPPPQQQQEQKQPSTVVFRCGQCDRVCPPPPDPLAAVQATGINLKLLRPTSAVLAEQAMNGGKSGDSSLIVPSSSSRQEADMPFYARHRKYFTSEEEEQHEAMQRQALLARKTSTGAGVTGRNVHSTLVVGGPSRRRRGGDRDFDEGEVDDRFDRSLWPDSHFNPPIPPPDPFKWTSERRQYNPLNEEPEEQREALRREASSSEAGQRRSWNGSTAGSAQVSGSTQPLDSDVGFFSSHPEPTGPPPEPSLVKYSRVRPSSAGHRPGAAAIRRVQTAIAHSAGTYTHSEALHAAATAAAAQPPVPIRSRPSSAVQRQASVPSYMASTRSSAASSRVADAPGAVPPAPSAEEKEAARRRSRRATQPQSGAAETEPHSYRFYNVHFAGGAAAQDMAKLASLYPDTSLALRHQPKSEQQRVIGQAREVDSDPPASASTSKPLIVPPPVFGSVEDAELELGDDLSVEIETNQG